MKGLSSLGEEKLHKISPNQICSPPLPPISRLCRAGRRWVTVRASSVFHNIQQNHPKKVLNMLGNIFYKNPRFKKIGDHWYKYFQAFKNIFFGLRLSYYSHRIYNKVLSTDGSTGVANTLFTKTPPILLIIILEYKAEVAVILHSPPRYIPNTVYNAEVTVKLLFPVYHLYCTVYHLSCLPYVLSPIFPVKHLSCLPSVLSTICPVSYLPCLPFVLSTICHVPISVLSPFFPVYNLSCLPSVLSAICPVCHLSCLPSVLSTICPVSYLSSLPFVLSIILHVHHLSCLPLVL